ncbi:hypothetical protein [Helicobacter vulpis]|uniref:hypothetical protein n=1 Tax=Helicobacter vulpis TaxID=2316076 RepID=UPI000EADE6FE|nr:hypothetical protein [Helicobacter vulpis]
MDKLNIAAVLHAEAKLHLMSEYGYDRKPKIAPLLWMCFLVHFWGFKWANCAYQMHVGFNELFPCPSIRDGDNRFDPFTHFTKKVHVFDKVVCVRKEYTENNKGEHYIINSYDLKTNLAIKDRGKQENSA